MSDDFKNAKPELIPDGAYDGPIYFGPDVERDPNATLMVGPFIAEPGDYYVEHSLNADGTCKCEVVYVSGPIRRVEK